MLFCRCIRGLLIEKAVVLVTHQVSFLNQVDEILVLEEGRIQFQGNYQDFTLYGESGADQ